MKKNPCKGCPFLKVSAPGWLGSRQIFRGQPEKYLQVMQDEPIPCHSEVKYGGKSDSKLREAAYKHPCVGSLQFLRNTFTMPREKRYAALRQASRCNSAVFETRNEFIDHHSI